MLTTAERSVQEQPDRPTAPRTLGGLDRWPMYRALVRKELRELAPWIGVAALLEIYVLCVATGVRVPLLSRPSALIPFIQDLEAVWMLTIGGLLGLAMGLWQTGWESSRGTFQYLLHRPLERQRLIGVKLLVGVTAMLFVSGLPIGLYSLWAATPGTHDSPFAWSMTLWCWQFWLALPLLYLGAFLSGLHPLSWYFWGSELAAGLLLMLLCVILWSAVGPWTTASAAFAAEAIFVVAIFYVARTRDFS